MKNLTLTAKVGTLVAVFLVALPVFFDKAFPLNGSSLVAEWELLLDPVRALREPA